MSDSIDIKELLWQWGRAMGARAGKEVHWYRQSPFAREIASGHRENAPPINQQEVKDTDAAVLHYLNGLRALKGWDSAEEQVFELRYRYGWELPDVARQMRKGQTWVKQQCGMIEHGVGLSFVAVVKSAA